MSTFPHTAFDLEPAIRNSAANGGYRVDQPIIPCRDLATSAGATITTTGAVQVNNLASSGMRGVRWIFSSDVTGFAILNWTVPRHYNQQLDDCRLFLALRKYDAAADENADLRTQIGATWLSPGRVDNLPSAQAATTAPTAISVGDTAVRTLTTPVSRTLAAASTTATGGFHWYEFDLSLSAARGGLEANRWRPGTIVQFEIGPNEAVGDTDMELQLVGGILCYTSHITIPDPQARSGSGFGRPFGRPVPDIS
jgi:hypothetical protein